MKNPGHYYLSLNIFKLLAFFQDQFTFTSFSVLSLSAIVIYTGGAHYVCVFCVDYIWYYYNDLESEIKTLGSFEKMLKNTPYNPITHGILYIYKK